MDGKFALFCGSRYYPEGGMLDFVCLGSIERCKARLIPYFDWAHIADMSTGKIVLNASIIKQEQDSFVLEWKSP